MRGWIVTAIACCTVSLALSSSQAAASVEASIGGQRRDRGDQPEAKQSESHQAAAVIARPATSVVSPTVGENDSRATAAEERQEVEPEQWVNVLRYLPGFLAENWDKVLASGFNGMLAWFTFLLWKSTHKLWRASEKQIELAREEFNASHRPKIVMRNVSEVPDGRGRRLLYSLINIGDADAIIVESWVMTEFVQKELAVRNLRCAGHNDLGVVRLKAGENRDFEYPIPPDASFQMSIDGISRTHARMAALYFTGSLRYEDPLGVSRTSVFRRIYKDAGFRRTDDRDHEYAD